MSIKQFTTPFTSTTNIGLVPSLVGSQPNMNTTFSMETSLNMSLSYPPQSLQPLQETTYGYDNPYSLPLVITWDNMDCFAYSSPPLTPYSDEESSFQGSVRAYSRCSSFTPPPITIQSSVFMKSYNCARFGGATRFDSSGHERHVHLTVLDMQTIAVKQVSRTTTTHPNRIRDKPKGIQKAPRIKKEGQMIKGPRRRRKQKEPMLEARPMSEEGRIMHNLNMMKVPWAGIKKKLNITKDTGCLQMRCCRERVRNHNWTDKQVCYLSKIIHDRTVVY